MSKYGIDANNMAGLRPKSITKVITFTQERDFKIEVNEDISDEELVQNFKDGLYSEQDAQVLTTRVIEASIKINESYGW